MFDPCLQVTGASAPYVVAVPSAEIVPPTLRAVAGATFEIPTNPDFPKILVTLMVAMLAVVAKREVKLLVTIFAVVAKREVKLLVAATFRVVDEMNGIVSVSKLKFVFVEFDVKPAAKMFVVERAFET